MATFTTLEQAEARAKSQVAANVWVTAHGEKDFNGVIKVRFQRFMSPSAPDNGAWVETSDDSVS